MTMELKVIENIQKLTWNFEEVKTKLTADIAKYTGLVVSETNLSDMEKTQKEIASLRIKLSKFRLAVKKDFEKPYEIFELQISQLTELIVKAEQPIKDQLQKYEDQRKKEKENTCKDVIAKISAELGLEDKYRDQIVVDSAWTNRGATMKSIKEDIQVKVCWFLDIQAQDLAAEVARVAAEAARVEKISMAKMLIEVLSKDLVTPLKFEAIESKVDQFNITDLRLAIESLVAERKDQEEKAAQLALERAEQKRIQEVNRAEKAEQTRIAEVDRQARIAEAHAAQLAHVAEKAKVETDKKLQEIVKTIAIEPVVDIKKYNAQFVAYNVTEKDTELIKKYFDDSGFEFKHAVKEVVKVEEEADY